MKDINESVSIFLERENAQIYEVDSYGFDFIAQMEGDIAFITTKEGMVESAELDSAQRAEFESNVFEFLTDEHSYHIGDARVRFDVISVVPTRKGVFVRYHRDAFC